MHLFYQDEGLELTKDQINMLKEKHKLKIDLCDSIYVVNPGGYVGESTNEEIAYAISKGKKNYISRTDRNTNICCFY